MSSTQCLKPIFLKNYSQLNIVFKHILSNFLTDYDKYMLLSFDRPEDFNTTVFLGVNLHHENNYALKLASENGNLSVVKYLVENGADIHTADDYALRWASQCGHLPVVKYLLEKGANIHAYEDFFS